MVPRHLLPAGRLRNNHAGMPFKQLRHERFMRGIEMLYDHKGHAGAVAGSGEQRSQRFQPACRSTDPDDRKTVFDQCVYPPSICACAMIEWLLAKASNVPRTAQLFSLVKILR